MENHCKQDKDIALYRVSKNAPHYCDYNLDDLVKSLQQILGVMDNAIYCFTGNLTFSSSEKNFENRLRFDRIIVTIGRRVF